MKGSFDFSYGFGYFQSTAIKLPQPKIEKTPFEAWCGRRPHIGRNNR
jgi:hypothetical protein